MPNIEKKINTILERGVSRLVTEESLKERLNLGRPLKIKHGVDPTTKDLHLGYLPVYNKLKILQELGHEIVILIGDFTARFGDPTAREKSRQLRDKEEINEAAASYLEQLSMVFDMDKITIRKNSEWYDKMNAEDFIRLTSHFTANRMLERDMFEKRIKKEEEIRLHELLYPVLQSYDSVVLQSDITVVGQDQLFNELQARRLQERLGQKPQELIATKILLGVDGRRKMSQSLGNEIRFKDVPREMYGKIMSIPDEAVLDYFELITNVPLGETRKIFEENKRKAKAVLAENIVAIFYGENEAQEAATEFSRVFKDKKPPASIPERQLSESKWLPLKLLVKVGLAESNSEARRLIEQKGVRLNQDVIEDWRKEIAIKDGDILKVGRRFIKLKRVD